MDTVSGSFLKTHPDSGSSVYNVLAFSDNVQTAHTVYFDKIDVIEQLDRAGNIFRVPIHLSETA